MASLREIKDRIASVKSTLKITSAMKLVASSKLRRAQKAIETLRPYEEALCDILAGLSAGGSDASSLNAGMPNPDDSGAETSTSAIPAAAIVVISSNSSLCGGFNGNVVKRAMEVLAGYECAEVFALGRKCADALRKAGYPSDDWSEIVASPSYKLSSDLARTIADGFFAGKYSKVLLVYNHFVSTAHQEVVVEQYLPFVPQASSICEDPDLYLVEPGRKEVLGELVPKVLTLKFHAAVLDSAAAEHAARTVAMQTATDNAQDLLDDLTLEYNKGRQQKITSEILDLLGGKTE